MNAEVKRDWRSYRAIEQLALVDWLTSRLQESLGGSESYFFYVTITPDRKESSHLNNLDRQYANVRASLVHRKLKSRCVRLYHQWNKRFFKRPSQSKGSYFPMVICIDDPIAKTSGAVHEASNGPHAHMVIGIQAKHLARWQGMITAGHLKTDAEKLFPKVDFDVQELPTADIPQTLAYSLKYDFQVIGNEPLWGFYLQPNVQ